MDIDELHYIDTPAAEALIEAVEAIPDVDVEELTIVKDARGGYTAWDPGTDQIWRWMPSSLDDGQEVWAWSKPQQA